MKILSEETFLQWVSAKGIHFDPRYPDSARLTFDGDVESRFWNVPLYPRHRPSFIRALMDLAGDWKTCYVRRHKGFWPTSIDANEYMCDAVELTILKGIGMPLGSAGVIEFHRDELVSLVSLLFVNSLLGFTAWDDLYVFPDHARQILETDHHDVVHVSFRDAEDVRTWVNRMTELGFPLPDDLPDGTFKRPPWMRDDTAEG